MLTEKGSLYGLGRTPGRTERSLSPAIGGSSINLKLEDMKAKLQIRQLRPKTAIDETKKAEIVDKARILQDKISKSYARDSQTFAALEERVSQLRSVIEKVQISKEAIATSHPRDLKEIGTSFSKEIAAELSEHTQALVDTQSNLIAGGQSLQSEFVHSLANISSGLNKQEQPLINDTQTVAMAFQQQKRDREVFFENLISKMGGAMISLHERLVSERAEREQTHRQRVRDLTEMRLRFVKAIEVGWKADTERKLEAKERQRGASTTLGADNLG